MWTSSQAERCGRPALAFRRKRRPWVRAQGAWLGVSLLLVHTSAARGEPGLPALTESCQPRVLCDAQCRQVSAQAFVLKDQHQYQEALQLLSPLYDSVKSCATLATIADIYWLQGNCAQAKELMRHATAFIPSLEDLTLFNHKRRAVDLLVKECPDPPLPPMPQVEAAAATGTERVRSEGGTDLLPAAAPVASQRRAGLEQPPLHRRWWLWTSLGTIVGVATAVGVGVGVAGQSPKGPAFPQDFAGYGNPTP